MHFVHGVVDRVTRLFLCNSERRFIFWPRNKILSGVFCYRSYGVYVLFHFSVSETGYWEKHVLCDTWDCRFLELAWFYNGLCAYHCYGIVWYVAMVLLVALACRIYLTGFFVGPIFLVVFASPSYA